MAIVEVASSAFSSSNSTSVTTNAWTPTTSSTLLVAMAVCGNGNGTTISAGTMTDSLGGTWTRFVSEVNYAVADSVAEIFIRDNASSSAMSCTYTRGGGNSSTVDCGLIVKGYSGAASTANQNGATASWTNSRPIASLTTTQLGSLVVGCAANATQYTFYPNGSTTDLGQHIGTAGDVEACFRATSLTTSLGSISLGYSTVTSTTNVIALAEILPSGTSSGGGATGTGVSILKPGFPSSALKVFVEFAFGYSPTSNPSSWTWTDCTTDVLIGQTQSGIQIQRGYMQGSTSSQPAVCSFSLKNKNGKYSMSAKAANYPNILRNTPVRVRLQYSGTSYTRFQGNVTSWTPSNTKSGHNPQVTVVANGAIQRVTQGAYQIFSPMKHGIPNLTSNVPVAYWPMEDKGVNSTTFASGFPNGYSMTITQNKPNFSSYSGFIGSDPLPSANNATYHGQIPTYTQSSPNQIQLTYFLNTPSTGSVNNTVISELHMDSDHPRWQLIWGTGGTLKLQSQDWSFNNLAIFGPYSLSAGIGNTIIQLAMKQTNSSQIDWTIYVYNIDSDTVNTQTGTCFGSPTLGNARYIHMLPGGENSAVVVGHVMVQTQIDSQGVLTNRQYYRGYTTEDPISRIVRLCTEQDEGIGYTGISYLTMGPQASGSFLDTIQQCADTDDGVLADGISQGFTFYSREGASAQPASLTLDVAQKQLVDWTPIDDDQVIVNSFQVTRPNGGTYTYNADPTRNKFNVNNIGLYAKQRTINCQTDLMLPHFASWHVHAGTTFGSSQVSSVRYPGVGVKLARNPSLASQVLATDILDRIDVKNLSSVLSEYDNQTISLLVHGYTENISSTQWDLVYNVIAYERYRVGVFAATTGDTGEFCARLEGDYASTLTSSVSSGVTSISVTTTSGPLWTTASDDFPLVINILDIPITVTAVTGSSSPQTFTVTGSTVTKNLAAGSKVTLWNQPILEL